MEKYKAGEERKSAGVEIRGQQMCAELWDALLRSHFRTKGLNPPQLLKRTTSSKVMTPSWEGLHPMTDLRKSVSPYTGAPTQNKLAKASIETRLQLNFPLCQILHLPQSFPSTVVGSRAYPNKLPVCSCHFRDCFSDLLTEGLSKNMAS